MAQFNLNVNGISKTVDVDSDTPLLWVLRDSLNMIGTKYGCGIAQCGSCTVHLDGEAVRACSLPVATIGNKQITTIEGLSADATHAVQEAWKEHDVPQCGYCQAGQIMNASSFLSKNPSPTDEDIDNAMNGNLCRCGTYNKIKAAIKTAATNI
ncbi:MAG: isoquinoline 1-oxidoreductase alpha subunit [Cyclobacteriaceae bacterium]|jgi:isoquinoline 1-oxidoreductase alpha subunit